MSMPNEESRVEQNELTCTETWQGYMESDHLRRRRRTLYQDHKPNTQWLEILRISHLHYYYYYYSSGGDLDRWLF